MKIEKLTEDKIRIIFDSSDLKARHIDLKSLMSKNLEHQDFFNIILEKAKNEIGFNTDGCKLLIEAFSTPDNVFVFTITRCLPDNISNKKVTVKRKSLNKTDKQALYKCNNFDTFCDFCKYLNSEYKYNLRLLSKNTYLYLYNNTYYFFMKNIISDEYAIRSFYSIASEFLTPVHYSSGFESKLLEYGKVIIKGNAIMTGIKYFC